MMQFLWNIKKIIDCKRASMINNDVILEKFNENFIVDIDKTAVDKEIKCSNFQDVKDGHMPVKNSEYPYKVKLKKVQKYTNTTVFLLIAYCNRSNFTKNGHELRSQPHVFDYFKRNICVIKLVSYLSFLQQPFDFW